MKTLVTGATGLVGYNNVKALLKENRQVKVLVRSLEKGKRLLPVECELVKGDITDKASIENAAQDCDVIYHAAGFPEQWMKNNDIFTQINVEGTQNIVDVAIKNKVKRFVYTSTIDVFAAKKGEEFDESIIDPHPKNTFYERSKQEADRRVAKALEKGLPAVFLHPSGVYGPGPTDSPGTNDFITKVKNKKLPALLPGGLPIVYAEDIGKGHLLAELKAPIGSRYILSEAYYELPALVKMIQEELKMPINIPPVLPMLLVKLL
jgi:nucleoside-diphosphate-sugar epimerase